MMPTKFLGENELIKIPKKSYFLAIMLFLLISDFTILFNIPVLQQFLGFISLTFIPGLLLLHIMKINGIGFLKKIVFSVGLSISFLMFSGLLINSFYPIIQKPLSLFPLIIYFNILCAILLIFAYKRFENKKLLIRNFDLNLRGKYLFIPLISILFPLMAIIGTYLMNYDNNNILLFVMLTSIPLYLILITYFKEKVPNFTYPLTILMISLALCLMHGLRSNNVTLADSCIEVYVLKLTLSNFHWDPSLFKYNYNSCLSLSILPTIYCTLLGIKELYVYKVVYNILFLLTPLCGYLVFRRYLDDYYAFLATFFLISQHIFISLYGWLAYRLIIASIFFALSVLTIFEDRIRKMNKSIILILFMFSMILSNYSTAYIFFIIIMIYWITSSILGWQSYINNLGIKKWFPEILSKQIGKKPKINNFEIKIFTGSFLALFFILMFVWYSQVNSTPFDDSVLFIKTNFINILNMAFEGLRSEEKVVVVGKQLADIFSYSIYYISFATIALGVFSLIRNNKIFDKPYFLMILISFIIAALLFVSSVFIAGFGVGRVYQELLIFLAPCFVIGAMVLTKFLSRFHHKLNWNWVIIILLIIQFSSSTYLIYQFSGDPHSEFLNSEGSRFESYFIQDKDYYGGRWLFQNNNEKFTVIGDYPGQYLYGQFDMNHINYLEQSNGTITDYIYLRTVNTKTNHIYIDYVKYNDISAYSQVFKNKNKIYSNGGSEIYR